MKEKTLLQRWVPTLLSRTLIRTAIPVLIAAAALVKFLSPVLPPAGEESVLWRQVTICLALALVLSLIVVLDLLIHIKKAAQENRNLQRRPSRWQ